MFFRLIVNLDWIIFQKETIKSNIENLKEAFRPKNIPKILRSIVKSKGEEGWSNLTDIEERPELYPIIRTLEENDLIIRRRITQFKLKNGLTEQVINNY